MNIIVAGENYIASSKAVDSINKKCEAAYTKTLLLGYKECECIQCGAAFIKFYASRARMCCACSLINKKIKAGEIVKLQAGYPKDTAIQSLEELESYYSGEKITCLLCGNEYRALTPKHLNGAHGVTTKEYKLMFGLYLSRGLLGSATRKIYSERQHEVMQGETKTRILKIMHQHNSNNPRIVVGCAHSPALVEKRKAISKAAIVSDNHISKRKNIVAANCSKCGETVEVSEATAITKRCKLLCTRCKGINHKESQQRWADKKGIDIKQFMAQCSRRSYLRNKKRKADT